MTRSIRSLPMMIDWMRTCLPPDLDFDGDVIRVWFKNGRQHIVRKDEGQGETRIWSLIARPSIVREQEDLLMRIWMKNHAARLVSYRIDEKGRLIGEAWLPE